MTDFAKLSKDIIGANPAQTGAIGVDGEIILINYDDIDQALTVVTNGVITALILKNGAKAYKFSTHNKGVSAEATLSKGTYVSAWIHKLTTRIFSKDQDIKDSVESLKDGCFVAIVANKNNGNAGDTKYEAYGFYSGLEMSEGTATSEDADSIFYTLALSSNENSKEPKLPLSFFKTDITVTKAMVDALLVVAV